MGVCKREGDDIVAISDSAVPIERSMTIEDAGNEGGETTLLLSFQKICCDVVRVCRTNNILTTISRH